MNRDDVGSAMSATSRTRQARNAAGRLRGSHPALTAVVPAKISRPQMLRPRLPRRRLIDALDAAVRRPVTVVCSGAGWGKSVLVSEWAQARRTQVGWLTLDSHDNDPRIFWSGVVAALRAAGAVPPNNPLAELRFIPADDVERVRYLTRGLSQLHRSAYLVLDDFHEIDDTRIISELVGLLRYAPRSFHLVILSRTEPTLPLPRLRAAGKLSEIRAADLAFTREEASALFVRQHFTLTSDDLTALLDRTEGWPAGLQLAAAFLAGPDGPRPISDFAGDVRAVDEYLADEVLAGQAGPLRQFLLHTSICEHLSGELADAISQQSNGQRTLEELERDNDFVVRLGAKPRWFRYHRLLRDVLRHRLLVEDPGVVPELHRRAARWYATQNSTFEALEHAVAARDWPYVGRLVVTQAAPQILSADRIQLTRILDRVPAEEFATVPELAVCSALMLFQASAYDAIPARLAEARQLLQGRPEADRVPIEITLRSLQLSVYRAVGNMPALVAETTQQLTMLARTHVAEVPSARRHRAIALDDKGVGLLLIGRPDRAERYLWAASTAARAAGVELVELDAAGHLALLEIMSGSVQEAARLADGARDVADRRGWSYTPQAVAAHLACALVHIERNEVVQAERALRQGLRAHRSDPEAAHSIVSLGIQARLALAQGEPTRARVFLNEARRGRRDLKTWIPSLFRWLLLSESEIDLAAGRPERVEERYARLALDELTFAERVCRAWARFAMHDLDRSEALLFDPGTSIRDAVATVESRILSALIADATGHGLRAADVLAEAFALAEQEGIHRPFIAMGGGRLDSLVERQTTFSRRNAAFVAAVMREMPTIAKQPTSAQPAGVLSGRETEVLRYLPTMMTAGDIAVELSVSINTVKAHMRSIYRKLEASRRREAVTTARAQGLI